MSQDPEQPGTDENYAAEGYDPTQNDGLMDDGPALAQAAPSVAAPPNRIALVLLAIVAVVVILVWTLSGSSGPTEEELAAAKQDVTVASPVQAPEPLPEPPIPTEPTGQTLDEAKLPPLPLPPPEVVSAAPVVDEPVEDPGLVAQRKQQEEQMRQRRLRSSMVVGGGLASKLSSSTSSRTQAACDTKNPNSQFECNTARTEVSVVSATPSPDSRSSIIQGKIINVVLESAINTDIPAPIRAIVSRDIYAEAGKAILVPKGSRVIGNYNTAILRGQKRIYMIWTRVIRPDGTSIAINSPGVDQLGRGGSEGIVDNKYLEVYSAAVLTSMVTVGAAVVADQVVDGQVSTSNNSLGGSNTTGSAGATAVQQSITDLGSTTRRVVDGVINISPTITLDQGTRLNIFVNRDLTFADGVGNSTSTVILQ